MSSRNGTGLGSPDLSSSEETMRLSVAGSPRHLELTTLTKQGFQQKLPTADAEATLSISQGLAHSPQKGKASYGGTTSP